MAGQEIVVRDAPKTPAQGPAGDAGPAGPAGDSATTNTVAVPQPVQLVDAGGQPVGGGGVGLEGPIIAALCGALIAQTFAAWVGHRFKRRDAGNAAFDHAYKEGMAARRKASRFAASIGHPKVDIWDAEPRETFIDALTDFRAAVALYIAIDDSSEVAVKLGVARDLLALWSPSDLSEWELDDLRDEEHSEGYRRGLDLDDQQREWVDSIRTSGNQLYEALQEAVAAFAEHSRRPWWHR